MLERYGHGGDLLTAEETYGRPKAAFLDFSSNMNPFGPPPAVLKAIACYGEDVMRYPDPVVRGLRGKLALLHGIPADCILAGNGAAELIDLAVRMLRPAVTALAQPSFKEYEDAVEKTGGRVKDIPLLETAGFLPEKKSLQEAMIACDVLFLGHPNNPTGRLLPAEWVDELVSGGKTVILDEAFIDFSPQESKVSFIRKAAESRNLLVIRSMTKFYAIPGIRLGYVVGHPELIREMGRLQVPWSVNSLAQRIGEAVLDEREYTARTIRWLPEERAWLAARLREIGITPYPSDTNFLLLSLPTTGGQKIKELQARLGRKGILVRDASLFKGLDDSFCRIAVRLREDNLKLLGALRECLHPSDIHNESVDQGGGAHERTE